MEITLHIKAPELVEAMNNLAAAFAGKAAQGNWYPGGSPESESAGPVEKAKATSKAKEEIETAPVDEPEVVEEYVAPQDMPTYTQDELREVATILGKAGKREELANLFTSIGVEKLSEIPEEHSGLMMDRMKEIIKAEGLE
jgi:hypothetical protein